MAAYMAQLVRRRQGSAAAGPSCCLLRRVPLDSGYQPRPFHLGSTLGVLTKLRDRRQLTKAPVPKKKAVPQESRCVLLQAGVFRAAAGNTPWQAARAHNRARLAQRARSWPLANQIRGTEQGLGPFRVPGWLFGMGVEVLGTSSFPAVENVEAIGRPQRPITALVQRRASALQRLCAQGGVIMR